jgi:hypothetical protein
MEAPRRIRDAGECPPPEILVALAVAIHALGFALGLAADEERARCVQLPGALQDALDVALGHGFTEVPADDRAAVAVEGTAQVVESAGEVDVGDVDVPVPVRAVGLGRGRQVLVDGARGEGGADQREAQRRGGPEWGT